MKILSSESPIVNENQDKAIEFFELSCKHIDSFLNIINFETHTAGLQNILYAMELSLKGCLYYIDNRFNDENARKLSHNYNKMVDRVNETACGINLSNPPENLPQLVTSRYSDKTISIYIMHPVI